MNLDPKASHRLAMSCLTLRHGFGASRESHVNMRNSGITSLLVAAMMLALSGCATIEVADQLNGQKLTDDKGAEPIAHLSGKNWGIYLTPLVPIISGSTDPDAWLPFTFFNDTVSVTDVADIVTRKSKAIGGTRTTDMTSTQASIWIIPIPFLWYKSVTVTGNSSK